MGISILVASILVQAQPAARYLTLTPPSGLPIIPIMEGWVGNEDGSITISFGFINRSREEAIDIPLGENNYIEPARFNGMQPTHFGTGRHTGVFTVTLPAELREESIWWHLKTGDSAENKAPGRGGAAAYELDFIRPRPQGSLQPIAWFEDAAAKSAGLMALVEDYPQSISTGLPVTLTVNAEDPSMRDASDPRFEEPMAIGLHWFKHQGPGEVEFARHESTPIPEPEEDADDDDDDDEEFDPSEVTLESGAGTARVTATFSEPGEYIIRTLVENFSAPDSGRGAQCCWTNVFQRISVAP